MFHVKHSPHILLINPWITDFAVYNFWIRPLGLLCIASLLRANGFRVTLIDCLGFPSKLKSTGMESFLRQRLKNLFPSNPSQKIIVNMECLKKCC